MAPQMREWMKPVITAILTGLVTAGTMLVSYGREQEKMDTLIESVNEHHKIYTPEKAKQLQNLELRVAVDEAKIEAMQETLNDIKRQNEQILRAVRR